MAENRQITLKSYVSGQPRPENFGRKTAGLPKIKDDELMSGGTTGKALVKLDLPEEA